MTVHLLKGDDESIIRAAVSELVHQLLGNGDRSLMVDDFDSEDFSLGAAIDAARTPPFLTDFRIVVVRSLERFVADDLGPLWDYLADPSPDTHLVMALTGGRMNKKITDAVNGAGGQVIATAPPQRANDRSAWIAERLEAHSIRLDRAAAVHLADWLGEDLSRVDGIASTLASTYGTGAQIGVEEVEPFLGDAGGVTPWALTDAIDQGQTAEALTLLHRMMQAGGRHPLQVMATLHTHYARLARLDGADARTESDAAAATGLKPGFQARKALDNYRRLGGDGVGRAISLLAAADINLRGGTDLENEMVMDLLVARLSKLTPRSGRSRSNVAGVSSRR
jgi:DNA polymerase III subunit delta